MPAKRILFVDDEYSLRLTLPQILKLHGFEVCAAGTVAQALTEITTHPYDILISDLNIGEAGDGFTVVSAMRRTQPECLSIILTGYPAFESALAAIEGQVDDYMVKPARVANLVSLIQERMENRRPRRPVQPKRLSELLREMVYEIREDTLARMKARAVLSSIPMNDEARIGFLPRIVIKIAEQMDSAGPDEPVNFDVEAGREHGLQRVSAGYTISMLVLDSAILDAVVFDLVQKHLLLLDISNVVLDLKRFSLALNAYVGHSVQAFCEASRSCGAGRAG